MNHSPSGSVEVLIDQSIGNGEEAMKQSPISPNEKDLPSEREIQDACQEIQQKWSDAERRRRAGLPKVQYWLPPFVPLEQMGYLGEGEPEPLS